jgi:SAM-dependent methyltransferase
VKKRQGALGEQTVADFGDQWVRYTDNSGFYGSLELFRDVFGPLLGPEDVRGRRVADVGSGTGRIVQMLVEAGAAHVTALEPSAAFTVLEQATRPHADRVRCLRVTGEQIPEQDFDLVVSVGVLHHIPEPRPVVDAAWRALRPGGRIAVWLYGREGNEAYLALVEPLRRLTVRLPHRALVGVCWLLTVSLGLYASLCRFLPLPLRGYMRSVISRLSLDKRFLVVYDQLNPAYARYYQRDEAISLLRSAGFTDVQAYHRHGYSWALTARRPAEPSKA